MVGLQRVCACTTDNKVLGIGGWVVAADMLPHNSCNNTHLLATDDEAPSHHLTAYHSRGCWWGCWCWWVARRKGQGPRAGWSGEELRTCLLLSTTPAASQAPGVYLVRRGQCEEHLGHCCGAHVVSLHLFTLFCSLFVVLPVYCTWCETCWRGHRDPTAPHL